MTHTQGVVARVEWEPVGDHGFSGIYEEGSDHAIMRLSETKNIVETSTGLAPSLAIKFLVDGIKSVNLFGMPRNFSHTDSWDFFDRPLSNRVTPFEEGSIEEQTLQKKMVEGSDRPFGTAISRPAVRTNEGKGIRKKHASVPYEIEYRGTTNFSVDKELDSEGE